MKARLDGIQYLRAIAALMVAFHHARHYFPDEVVAALPAFGQYGVDVFFVISGYLMARVTAGHDPAAPRRALAISFLRDRVLRVVPLYWLALTACALSQYQYRDPGLWMDFLFIPRESLSNPGRWWPALIPGWTVNYEMFFYGLFGLAILLVRQSLLLMLAVLFGLVAVGFSGPSADSWLSFYSHPIVLNFAFGILLHFLTNKQSWQPSVPWVAVIALASLWALSLPRTELPRFVSYGLPSAGLVWAAIHWPGTRRSSLLSMLGDASYSIYLWHFLVFKVLLRLGHAGGLVPSGPIAIGLVLAAQVLLAALIGVAMYQWLERPLLRALRNYFQPSSSKHAPA